MLYWFGVDQLGRACLWRVPSALGMASLLNRLYQFGVVGLCTPGVNQQGAIHLSIGHYYIGVVGVYTWGQLAGEGILISQYVILVWCSRALYTWAQLAGEGLLISQQVILCLVQQGFVHLGSISGEGPPHFSISYLDFVQQGYVHLGLISRRGPPHFSIGSTGLLQQGSVHLGSISRLASLFPNQLYSFGIVGICTLKVDQLGRACFRDVHLPLVYVHSSICENYLVQQFSRDLCLMRGGGGVSVSWVYGHSSICETYSVQCFFRDLCLIGGGGGQLGTSAFSICAFFYM